MTCHCTVSLRAALAANYFARSTRRFRPAGTYQYKFIVDNEWRFATDQPTVRDEMGNINNCITVIDQAMYLHEHAASGFFGDTPHNMYSQVRPPLPC